VQISAKFFFTGRLCKVYLAHIGGVSDLKRIKNHLIFFEFGSLEFICYLGFVVWGLQYFKAHHSITLSEP